MKPCNAQTSVFLTALLFFLAEGFTGNSSDQIEGKISFKLAALVNDM